jgi:hypothetical protein
MWLYATLATAVSFIKPAFVQAEATANAKTGHIIAVINVNQISKVS